MHSPGPNSVRSVGPDNVRSRGPYSMRSRGPHSVRSVQEASNWWRNLTVSATTSLQFVASFKVTRLVTVQMLSISI
jgi:hypothetical protein